MKRSDKIFINEKATRESGFIRFGNPAKKST